MKPTSVQSLSLQKPLILKQNSTLKQAALAMKSRHVGSVLVSDGRGLLQGLFTDRDLALALAVDDLPASSSLGTAAPHRLIYVPEEATISDVIETMKKYGIRRVPVIKELHSGRQRCLGVISLDDLIRKNLISADEEAAILRTQLKTPKTRQQKMKIKNIFHSQDHREQSYYGFIKHIETRTGLNSAQAKSLAQNILAALMRRVPAKAGKNLLSQLPYQLQMPLIGEVSPADRSVTAKYLLNQIQRHYTVKEDKARKLLQGFWKGLSDSISPGEMQTLTRQLPRDMQQLFVKTKRVMM